MNKFINKEFFKRAALTMVVALVLIIILFPIVWMLPSAFKSSTEIFAKPVTWLPKEWVLSNFDKLFNNSSTVVKYNYVVSFFFTLAVASTAVILSLFFNMLTAYVFARFEFRGKKILWVYFLFSMFVPGITILLTSIEVVNRLGFLTNEFTIFWGLVLPGVLTSYNVFFFRQFFYGLPSSLEEAAEIDGMNSFGMFIRIFIPLAITPMIVQGASVFMGFWNSYLWPSLIVPQRLAEIGFQQIMPIIMTLNTSFPRDYGIPIAATMISMVGPLTIFLFAQKKIIQGIAISGLK